MLVVDHWRSAVWSFNVVGKLGDNWMTIAAQEAQLHSLPGIRLKRYILVVRPKGLNVSFLDATSTLGEKVRGSRLNWFGIMASATQLHAAPAYSNKVLAVSPNTNRVWGLGS